MHSPMLNKLIKYKRSLFSNIYVCVYLKFSWYISSKQIYIDLNIFLHFSGLYTYIYIYMKRDNKLKRHTNNYKYDILIVNNVI